ncbi:DUF6493 family protein [Kineosporia babensis]|uniref:DUF6493 family protein n=1 Tax=Kineosporia babensis TaxID=499548 RepID=A0A9X1NLL6_9ACTN|nr:DUF6493 family protein [Kineosporia babensis]MCD5315381.1 DUF6493 family protein [Kineosporia babensis]
MEWDELFLVMRKQGAEGTTTALLELTDAQRRVLAPEVAGFARAAGRWWTGDDVEYSNYFRNARRGPNGLMAATAVAVVGTLPASRIPAALRRIEIDASNGRGLDELIGRLFQVLEARKLTGSPKLAADLVGRVRETDVHSRAWFFHLSLELTRRGSGELPHAPGFLRLWIENVQRVLADVRARPSWSVLIIRALEVRDTGHLFDQPGRRQMLLTLNQEGLLARSELIDACVAALQTNDRQVNLHGLIALHDSIDPKGEEVVRRIGQYLSLIAAAPANVASLAQQRLRALDEQGDLPTEVLREATVAVLARLDKGLFRAQLSWLRTALKNRSDEQAADAREKLLPALSTGLGHPDAALQKMVLNLLAPYAGHLSASAREHIGSVAQTLPPDLRDRAAQLFIMEPLAAPAAGSVLPVPPPSAALVPITDSQELTEELAVLLQSRDWWAPADLVQIERILGALVQLSWREPEKLRATMTPLLEGTLKWLPREPPSEADPYLDEDDGAGSLLDVLAACVQSAQACAERAETDRKPQVIAQLGEPGSALTGSDFNESDLTGFGSARPGFRPKSAGPGNVLRSRLREIAHGIWWSPVPVLLSTPTSAAGVLEADALIERLQQHAAVGSTPWTLDLEQAWLRVSPADRHRVRAAIPGEIGLSRLEPLHSARAEAAFHTWTRKVRPWEYWNENPELKSSQIVALSPASAVPSPWHGLWHLPVPRNDRSQYRDTSWLTLWPSLLPFDRDVMAAQLVRDIPELGRGAGDALRAHAEGLGPIGAAGHLLHCIGLDLPDAAERAGATDALITLIGRGQLDTRAFGQLLGGQIAEHGLKLNRVVGALRGIGEAGGWAPLGQILIAALPPCLAAQSHTSITRLADLVALTVESVQQAGPSALGEGSGSDVPGLAEVAGRSGSSRLRSEARRLQSALEAARAPEGRLREGRAPGGR